LRVAEIVLYHNPRCSKSRAALGLLRERGVEPRIVEYLATPPTRDELEALRRKLGLEPRAWLRPKEEAYAAAGLSEGSSEDAVLEAMAAHPILIERPIAVRGERAVVGRPPERVLELL
jgi:arsenate reductase